MGEGGRNAAGSALGLSAKMLQQQRGALLLARRQWRAQAPLLPGGRQHAGPRASTTCAISSNQRQVLLETIHPSLAPGVAPAEAPWR